MRVIRADESDAQRGERFTGTVWVDRVLTAQRPGGMRLFLVCFEPGSRTHWHAHEGEQTLYVVAGSGHVRKSGEPGMEIGPGDIVYIAPGEKHWHGAGPKSAMVHLAVTTGGDTTWMGAVAGDQ